MKLKYLLLSAGIWSLTINAQEQEATQLCGEAEINAQMWEEDPSLKDAYYKMHNQILSKVNGPQLKDGNEDKIYIIPIVFHVLHEYGSENISDEQIYRAVEILNEDYRKVNADTADIVPEFKAIATDSRIEFRLATRDPIGRPTNGIVRYHTNETNVGDAFSKVSQWPRGRYMNVWIARKMGVSGAAGYAVKPIGTEGGNRFVDGIMILHNYIGDVGTGNPFRSRALTHEFGHSLGLSHVWGDNNGDDNFQSPKHMSPQCGDDGIHDTPMTQGWKVCILDEFSSCNASSQTVENVQNYMEYSYCSNMFTEGQVAYMRNILELEVGQRNNLWTTQNLENSIPETGGYDPIADFFVDYQVNANRLVVCEGNNVRFRNWSWRLSGSGNETYLWTFEDGSTPTSTQQNPTVSFTSPGWKDVSLTVEDNGRTHTVTKENFIWVAPNWAPFSGKVQFDFNDQPNYWVIQNPTNQPYEWEVRDDAGTDGSGGIFLNTTNPYNPEDVVLFSDEYFFDVRRGGVKSSFVSQPINLEFMSDINLTFDYACATNGSDSEDIVEELNIYTSTDCGASWVLRKKISGIDLINNGSGWDSFYPSNTTIWTTDTIPLIDNISNHLFLKFEYVGSDLSNNIAIDNINFNGILSAPTYQKDNDLTIFPNPSNQETGWNIQYESSKWGGAQIELLDVSGRVISKDVLPKNQTEWNIQPDANSAKGVYFLKIRNQDKVIQNKLILK